MKLSWLRTAEAMTGSAIALPAVELPQYVAFVSRLERFTNALDLPAPNFIMRDQARRWGSCNEKVEVRINWRILQAPIVLVD